MNLWLHVVDAVFSHLVEIAQVFQVQHGLPFALPQLIARRSLLRFKGGTVTNTLASSYRNRRLGLQILR